MEPIIIGFAEVLEEYPSGKAIKVRIDDTDVVSIPKTGIHDNSEVWRHGQQGELVLKRWCAEMKGYA